MSKSSNYEWTICVSWYLASLWTKYFLNNYFIQVIDKLITPFIFGTEYIIQTLVWIAPPTNNKFSCIVHLSRSKLCCITLQCPHVCYIWINKIYIVDKLNNELVNQLINTTQTCWLLAQHQSISTNLIRMSWFKDNHVCVCLLHNFMAWKGKTNT